jgi:NAD(P)-dependent dehydrogenase (short-subunit alcohol dehydrogenase family)
VNLLCANAGVLARVGPLADHTIGDWQYTLSVNVMGVVKTVAAFLPALRASAPDAHIVNTASLGGLTSDVRAPIGAYVASKYACVGYSEMLRAELEGEGIGSRCCARSRRLNLSGPPPRPTRRVGRRTLRSLLRRAQRCERCHAAVQAMAAENGADRDPRDPGELHALTHPRSRPLRRTPLPRDARRLDFAAGAECARVRGLAGISHHARITFWSHEVWNGALER